MKTFRLATAVTVTRRARGVVTDVSDGVAHVRFPHGSESIELTEFGQPLVPGMRVLVEEGVDRRSGASRAFTRFSIETEPS